MKFAMESQELKELLFWIVLRKNNKSFKKIENILLLGPFYSNLGKNELSTKIGLRHFLTFAVLQLSVSRKYHLLLIAISMEKIKISNYSFQRYW